MFRLMANCCLWLKRWREPIRKVTLVMVGLDNAGKTAALKGIQGESPEDVAPTVGFSRIDLKQETFEVTIYDLGGGKKIRDIWKNYYAESFGVIFVLDSSDIDRMEEVKDTVANVLRHPKVAGKPVLVLANKQDCDGALSEACIIEILKLENLVNANKCRCLIKPCCAVWGYGKNVDQAIKKGLTWLLTTIAKDYDGLQDRVQNDTMEQKAQEEQEKQERAERVRKIREEREQKEREGTEKDDNSLNQFADDEPNPQINPFQPISKVISVNEEKIRRQKEKNQIKSNEEHLQNIVDKEAPKMEEGIGDDIQNADQVKSDANAEASTKQREEETGHDRKIPGSGKKKIKKIRMKRKNKVEPISTDDDSENSSPSPLTDFFKKLFPPVQASQKPNSDTHDVIS
ncbi:ADP-ribosylation factor-like protein 13B isoform X2 [Narcine bancroftii]|uniref:ADP-ribosylation factor-like protein 13B isoform X2 n=1 Tax=Narcine bancroftii TaxID=1343680 RepID=UPI003831525E